MASRTLLAALVCVPLITACSLADEPVQSSLPDDYLDNPVVAPHAAFAEDPFTGAGGFPPYELTSQTAIDPDDRVAASGDRLFVLSRYGALLSIDRSHPAAPALTARLPLLCRPFALFARENDVVAVCDGHQALASYGEAGNDIDVTRPTVYLVDTTRPSTLSIRSSMPLLGSLRHARLEGGSLLAVTYGETCDGCVVRAGTVIRSLSLGDSISVSGELALGDNPGPAFAHGVTGEPGRLYVAVQPRSTASTPDRSYLHEIDTTDPSSMRSRQLVPLAGTIKLDAQLDISQRTLRLLEEPVPGLADQRLVLEVFSLDGGLSRAPLASLPMSLKGSFLAARFDGPRAFVVGHAGDPRLVALDLSDPAAPREASSAPFSATPYQLEPRGDRLFVAGFAPGNQQGAASLSLFDIGDVSKVSLLSSVSFGGPAASLTRDRTLPHEAMAISDDSSLVAAPFATFVGWRPPEAFACGRFDGAVQLIGRTGDALELRGVASTKGGVGVTLLDRTAMQVVSDEQVAGFDLADLDSPSPGSQAALQRRATRVIAHGDIVATLSSNRWRGEGWLELRAAAAPPEAPPAGVLDLSSTSLIGPDDCRGDERLRDASLSTHQGALVIASSSSGADPSGHLMTIDIVDPKRPRLLADVALPFANNLGPRRDPPSTSNRSSALVDTGSPLVIVGNTLAWLWAPLPSPPGSARVELIDLTDLAHPSHVGGFDLPAGAGGTLLLPWGDDVATSHFEPIEGHPDEVRFFIDRIRLSPAAAPQLLAPVESPGSLAFVDTAASRAMTISYRRVLIGEQKTDCYTNLGAFWPFGRFYSERVGCWEMHRTMQWLDTSGPTLVTLGVADLDDPTHHTDQMALTPRGLALTRLRAFSGDLLNTELLFIDGLPAKAELFGGLPLETGRRRWGRALIEGVAGSTVVSRARSPLPALLLLYLDVPGSAFDLRAIPLPHALHEVAIAGDRAFVAMQPYGLATVELRHR